jgi:hypothetical protein
VIGGILGFLAAAIRLRIAYGKKKGVPLAVADAD